MMGDLSPISAKLGLLLPRLASDMEGEVVATVRAIGRTLRASGCDWHDVAAKVQAKPPAIHAPKAERAVTLHDMATGLRLTALDRLTPNQRDFVVKMTGQLTLGGALTGKQAKYLRDLYAQHCAGAWA